MSLRVRFWPRDITASTRAAKEFLAMLRQSAKQPFVFGGYTFHPTGIHSACIVCESIPKKTPTIFNTQLPLGMVTIQTTVMAYRCIKVGDYETRDAGGSVIGISDRKLEICVVSVQFPAAVELYNKICDGSIKPKK